MPLPYNIFDVSAEPVRILMCEKFSPAYMPSGDKGKTMYYWVSEEWVEGSVPGWGDRRTFPIHSSVPTGKHGDMYCFGADWDPENEVMGCLTGYYDDSGDGHFFFHRSTDYGETWNVGVSVGGSDPSGSGYAGPNGFWWWNWGTTWWQTSPGQESLKYCGSNTWVMMGADELLNQVSTDGGDTWTANYGTRFTASSFYYGHLTWTFAHNLITNWMFAEGAPFAHLVASPPTVPNVVAGGSAPAVARGLSSLTGNCWNIPSEWWTDYLDGIGCPPLIAENDEADLAKGDHRGYVYIPGAGGVWMYTGDQAAFGTDYEVFARVVGDEFTIGQAELGTSVWLVSQSYQNNVYDGWSYGIYPVDPRVQEGCRFKVSPHPTINGGWRVWHFQGQIGLNICMSLCHSDNQGATWLKDSDYSGTVKHPIFDPSHGYPNVVAGKHVPPWMFIGDLLFHPRYPKTILTTGYVQTNTPNPWATCLSTDGGESWAAYEQLDDPAGGGPENAYHLIPVFKHG